MPRLPAFIPVSENSLYTIGNNGFQPVKQKIFRLFGQEGLTLIEVLVVIGILAILSTGAFINVNSSSNNRALVTSGDKLADNLRRAQIFSSQTRDTKAWAVRYADNYKYQIVSGDPLNPATWKVYQEFELEKNISFRADAINFKVWFMKGTGEKDSANSVLVGSNKIFIKNKQGRELKLEISQTGVIQTQVL